MSKSLEAAAKINTEMQKDPQNLYMEIIGHYVIDRTAEEDAAACVLAHKKTLAGAMESVVERARKKQRGNAAVLMPDEVFDAVDAYFGLHKSMKTREAAMRSVTGGTVKAEEQENTSRKPLALNLEDLF